MLIVYRLRCSHVALAPALAPLASSRRAEEHAVIWPYGLCPPPARSTNILHLISQTVCGGPHLSRGCVPQSDEAELDLRLKVAKDVSTGA